MHKMNAFTILLLQLKHFKHFLLHFCSLEAATHMQCICAGKCIGAILVLRETFFFPKCKAYFINFILFIQIRLFFHR